jgi:hypothetical protein
VYVINNYLTIVNYNCNSPFPYFLEAKYEAIQRDLSGIVLSKGVETIEIITGSAEACILLTHHLMDPFHKEFPGLLLEVLHQFNHDIFV